MSPRLAQGTLGIEVEPGGVGPDARDLPTSPCPTCGASIIAGFDLSSGGRAIYCDPAPRVALVVGARGGTPLMARPSNGLAVHRCAGRAS